MATLVLSTVGTMLGGPVGGAIGSLLGQSIDQQLLGPRPQRGPRIGDLAVQSSNYGTQIPQVFGTMRVAGSIIWSTDLQESTATISAKGEPDRVSYRSSVSFAVALSSRPLVSVRRIWADGKLIRSADGTFTVATGFRLLTGAEDQSPDPLIASIEGIDSTPSYRGLAVAVFESLDLGEFGNRIPFLTFEVVAEQGEVAVGEILAETTNGLIVATTTAQLKGYAAHGPTMRAAIAPLIETLSLPLFDDGTLLRAPSELPVPVDIENSGCTASAENARAVERSMTSASALPAMTTITFYDPQRDYQLGLASASLGRSRESVARTELPAVVDATFAKALAEHLLARHWAERDKVTLRLPPEFLALPPGALLQGIDESGPWRAEHVTIDGLATVLELRATFDSLETLPADSGRVLPSSDAVSGPTSIIVAELPDDGSGQAATPVVVVAAATSSRWRPVPLLVEIGPVALNMTSAPAPAVVGTARTTLDAGPSAVLDELNHVEVELVDAEQWLESCDEDALIAGANMAMIGREVCQFANALPLGDRRFRLSRFLRGRRGSEWAMSTHASGENFLLLDPARLQPLPLRTDAVGATVRVTPGGPGNETASATEHLVSGEALRPPSPVHLKAQVNPSGELSCTWIRRSAGGWSWSDGVDSPLGAAIEKYRVVLTGSGVSLAMETGAANAEFTAADVAAAGPGQLELSVVQVGDLAVSRAATLSFNLS